MESFERKVMFSHIRSRVTYGNVAVVIVVLFTMTGAAYASGKWIITSPKQIKPSVLKSLQGKIGPRGSAGPTGPAGAQGSAGANGSQGVQGLTGKEGPEGKPGPEGKQGPKGENGTTGFTATLPSGKTETGAWAGGWATGGQVISTSISFSIPLAAPLSGAGCNEGKEPCKAHLVTVEQAAEKEVPAGCIVGGVEGSATHPLAAPGFLCVYAALESKIVFEPAVVKPITAPTEPSEEGAGETGAVLRFLALEAGGTASGTWAVTAP
jgi:hypothetical protein